MDKNAIKKYAVWARRELISRVTQKAFQYGITENNISDADNGSINGKVLSASEAKQRQALAAQIRQKDFEQVMEEAAYTWFNRFSALRFMEVNGYLPSHVRVFTDDSNSFKPQILTEAINLDFDGLDMNKVYALRDSNDDEQLFKYLVIIQCNALNAILPGMFQKIDDYTELLFPDNLLREGSVVEKMITLIPEEDWKDQVQIIGWLYQYYNTEPKDKVFADLKKNIKISKENIPAATQLFTPDWIVRYMVENSLGRLWLEGHSNDELKAGWKYYLDEAEQEPEVREQLAEIRREYADLKPEQIRCIDPCSGSGHICAYLFDVLVQIYEAYGYTAREAVSGIVEHNLCGLDIDDRAAQLAYFSVMMKARQYDRRFFSRSMQPRIYAVRESNNLDDLTVKYFCNGDAGLEKAMNTLIDDMRDAKEYGSLLNITQVDFTALYSRFDEIAVDVGSIWRESALNELLPFVQAAELLAQKYDVVCTNPPYMGVSNANGKLQDYIKNNFPDSKADLFACFIEQCGNLVHKNGLFGMITQHAWMFLSSFENLRKNLLAVDTVNMAHLGARAFEEIGGEVVQTTSFVMRRSNTSGYKGTYCRLIEPTTQQGKEDMFLTGENRYIACQDNFSKIPNNIIAYWLSNKFISVFENVKIESVAKACKGLDTADNNRFLRFWFEIDIQKKNTKWIPYNKGGGYRKWYGLNEYLLNWENNGYELKNNSNGNIRNETFYFHQGLTWSDLSTSTYGIRYCDKGFIFDASGPMLFCDDLYYYCGYMNSIVYQKILNIVCPGLHYNNGAINRTPIILAYNQKKVINGKVLENINLCKTDWDSFETSWDFKKHPLINGEKTVSAAFEKWSAKCGERFDTLKANEEELNRIFIDIYGLRDELSPEVEDKNVTVRKADLQREVKSLISYAVGCMFGRYSLDVEGLAYAGGEWDNGKYITFPADKDNILPICDDEYFDDDIVNRFADFIRTVYGGQSLETNLKFIADALGGKGQPRDVIRNYFLNDFYADHLKIYQKRPIYWLFDSGKKNGFKCLVYMHRYQRDTIARIRTDYVHEQQSRYHTAIADLEQRINGASAGERVKLGKQLSKLRAQSDELHEYEEKIHHLADQYISIDLDDGVKVNYAKFQDVLARIK